MSFRKKNSGSAYLTVMKDPDNIVEFENVHTYFFTDSGMVKAMNGISFDIPKGKIVGIVGESGCGKTVTALSLFQLLDRSEGQTIKGQIRINMESHAVNVINAPAHVMQKLRGKQMSMIFQEPATSLNPVFRIGCQMDEVIKLHHPTMYKKERKNRTLEMLELVGITNKEEVYKMYPHELSGGMCQRIMLAIALVCHPRIIVADEPTTALDVTTQAQILDLLLELKNKLNITILLITHDLGVIAQIADEMIVMKDGSVVEKGSVKEIFKSPQHPYTVQLMRSHAFAEKHFVKIGSFPEKKDSILEVSHLKKYFPQRGNFISPGKGIVKAVDDVSFTLKRGTTLGLVGESGCGKSTTGRTILRLLEKTDGNIFFNGQDISKVSAEQLRLLRTKMQIIFQDPYACLSPRLTIDEIMKEAVREHNIVPKIELDTYISAMMRACGLQESYKQRYPHEFSGGQRQRICIARALALRPEFIVCDEPVSALDISMRTQIINLLQDLQEKYHLTYLFISHDLSVVEHISDTVAIMYLGSIIEIGATEDIFRNPLHPYTKALFSAILIPDPDVKGKRIILKENILSSSLSPSGCKFQTRCIKCTEICKMKTPVMQEIEKGHMVCCHLYDGK